jgi:hypothetical protein
MGLGAKARQCLQQMGPLIAAAKAAQAHVAQQTVELMMFPLQQRFLCSDLLLCCFSARRLAVAQDSLL